MHGARNTVDSEKLWLILLSRVLQLQRGDLDISQELLPNKDVERPTARGGKGRFASKVRRAQSLGTREVMLWEIPVAHSALGPRNLPEVGKGNTPPEVR
jgi:hypothetical protein